MEQSMVIWFLSFFLQKMGSGLKDKEGNPVQKPIIESNAPAFSGICGVKLAHKTYTSTRTPHTKMTVVWQSQTPSNYIILYYIILYYIILYYIILYYILYYIILYYIILYNIILYYILYYIILDYIIYYIISSIIYYIIRRPPGSQAC